MVTVTNLAVLVLAICALVGPKASGHQCSHGHHHHHDHDEELEHQHDHGASSLLKDGNVHKDHGAEALEEKELEEYGFEGRHRDHEHDHEHSSVPLQGVWLQAMGSSLLVSSASLVCLAILPLIVTQGKPAKGVVNALAAFGAGTMLGDAFLHQLPHAFGGDSHSHDSHGDHGHHHHHHSVNNTGASHGHTLEDLSVGLAVLVQRRRQFKAGQLLFGLASRSFDDLEFLRILDHEERPAELEATPRILIAKIDLEASWGLSGHSHHHFHHKKDDSLSRELKEETEETDGRLDEGDKVKTGIKRRSGKKSEENIGVAGKGVENVHVKDEPDSQKRENELASPAEGGSKLVFGYLNLFSDAVHNFTDGMALGSAFLVHGRIGGWSRTLFLLAHELPQEVGDFGILVKSGFTVFKALAFNFLSALVALAGTALALLLEGGVGNSSIIEGFTAGGFIYIAVGSVVPDMHAQGNSFRTSVSQLSALVTGIGVAVAISLAE